MDEKFMQDAVMKSLDWAYGAAMNAPPGGQSAQEMAADYLSKNRGDRESAVRSLVKFQLTKAAVSGFVTGLGGVMTLPVAIPVNLASVLYFQIRMVGAIALINGYDLRSDQVQTCAYACIAGSMVSDLAKEAGVQTSTKIANTLVRKIPGAALRRINKRVGFRLVTKFGAKGSINLIRMVPFAGGLVGAALDVATTKLIAKTARKTFKPSGLDLGDGVVLDIGSAHNEVVPTATRQSLNIRNGINSDAPKRRGHGRHHREIGDRRM